VPAAPGHGSAVNVASPSAKIMSDTSGGVSKEIGGFATTVKEVSVPAHAVAGSPPDVFGESRTIPPTLSTTLHTNPS